MARKLLILLILFLSIGCAFSANEYEFKITIDHGFEHNEEIVCELEYDNNQDTYTFDEDSTSDDLEIIENFNDYMNFDCDENLDTIRFYVYNQDGDRIFKELYEDEDRFNYELDLVDEDEQYFRIDINDDFTSTNDCELTIDGHYKFDFRFDEDSSNNDKEILRNFNDDFTFECDDELEDADITVYNDNGERIFDKTYYNKDLIEFDIDDTLDKNEFRLEIDHNFGNNEEISCDLEIDDNSDLDEEFTFDSDTSSADFIIVRAFEDAFIFDCNKNIDEIQLRIYNELGEKVDSQTYEDDDKINYEYNNGQYEFMFEITTEFTEEVDCELKIDDDKSEYYTFDEDSGISDKRIEGNFNQKIILDCERPLEKVELFIFEDSEEHNGKLLAQKAFTSKSLIEYTFDITDKENLDDIKDEVLETSQEGTPTTPTNPTIENKDITTNINESNLIDTQSSNELNANINASQINQNKTENNLTNTAETNPANNGTLGTVAFILFLIIVIVVLILGVIKAITNKQKRSPKKNQKVDFEFLNKKNKK